MKKRKREKNFIRNRSGGMKRKLPGRLLSLMCALILVLSTVFLDLGHISRAYAFDDDLYLETESEETEDAGVETQAADPGDDESQISTELSEDTSEDPDEVFTEEAADAGEADFSSGDNLDEQELTTEEKSENADDSTAETIAYTQLVENDTVEVRAEAPAGALPEGAQLVVKPITNTTDDAEETQQYTDVQNKLVEQAQNNNQDLCGFLAYDIYFVDSEGQKVEPTADVKVSMNYKEAAIPDEVTDAAVLSADEAADAENAVQTPKVEVLHFVEDQNGLVQDIVNMTQEGQANVETTSDGQVQKAEFNTGSFSVFTITWTQLKQSDGKDKVTHVTVKYVDPEGNDISSLVTSDNEIKATKGTVIRLADYEPYITGYGFTKALIGGSSFDSTAPELKLIKAANDYSDYNTYWTYSYSNDTDPNSANWTTYGSGYNDDTAPTVYLIYAPMQLSIRDDLLNTGRLIPELTDDMQSAIAAAKENGEDVSWIWYKSVNNGDFEAVDKVKVSGDKYNIETNEDNLDCLNVAMDSGALSTTQSSVRYKVALQIEGQDEILSGEYNVRYYEELHNGGFETPAVTNDHPNASNWQYSNENYRSQGGVWQTTGTNAMGTSQWCDTDGADIEIVSATASDTGKNYDWNGTVYDANEVANQGQFAELNCEAAGALYQDVITYSGEKLNFWLSHRARGSHRNSNPEYDTMYVVMAPTSIVKDCTTQSQLEELIGRYVKNFNINQSYTENGKTTEGKEILYNQDGVLIERVTSDDQDWQHITETAKYTATSNMTRFFFVAGKTASGNKTVGNFLDNVGFGQGLPPANKGTFTLKVVKKFTGLTPSDNLKRKVTFTIRAYNEDGSEAPANAPLNGTSFTLSEMTESDGNYSKTFENQSIDANKKYIYKVVETNSQVNGYAVATTQTVSGGKVQSDKKTTLIGEKDSATFTIINKYTDGIVQSKTAKLSNQENSWENRVYDITLSASSVASTTEEADAVDVMLVLDQSGSMNFRSGLIPFTNCNPNRYNSTLVKGQLYYWISDDYKATVYRTQYNNGRWQYRDDSYETGDWSNFSNRNYQFYTAVADASDGQCYNRNHYLKQAATSFVDNLASISPDSRIGLVTFNKNATAQLNGEMKKVGNNLDLIKGAINNSTTAGGTRQDIALQTANNILSKDTGTRRKYVILFTDGCPNDKDLDAVRNNMGTEAANIKATITAKNKDSKLITVSVGLEGNENNYIQAAEQLLKTMATTENDSYNVSNADALSGVFKNILSSITTYYNAEDATIKDYIDSRFEVDEDSVKAAGGTVGEDEGGIYVIWEKETILPSTNGNPGWTKTFQVKAKDTFIGGNNITTNGPGSGITVDGVTREFKRPKVNVRSNININDKEITIYKGDKVPTDDEILKQIFDKTAEVTSYGNGVIGQNEIKELMDAGKLTMQWYSDPGCQHPTDMTTIGNTAPDDTTQYYLKVTYDAGAPSEESNANTVKDGTTYISGDNDHIQEAINKNNDHHPYGIYKIKVIKGQIVITKQVEETPTEDKIFEFEITKKEDSDYQETLSITVNKGSTVGTAEASLTNLSRGTYYIKEKSSDGYTVANATVAENTDCENDVSKDGNYQITFKLGYEKGQTDVDVIKSGYTYTSGGVTGAVNYTNSEIKANLDLKKTDAKNGNYLDGAKFSLKMKSGENWIPAGDNYQEFEVKNDDTVELKNLKTGNYKLTELTAPTGYALLTGAIYFSVDKGTVTLTNEKGKKLSTAAMCTLDTSDPTHLVLTVKNTELYSLPSSGGPGTYMFTISGVAFITAALLLFINNKRKEDEARI